MKKLTEWNFCSFFLTNRGLGFNEHIPQPMLVLVYGYLTPRLELTLDEHTPVTPDLLHIPSQLHILEHSGDGTWQQFPPIPLVTICHNKKRSSRLYNTDVSQACFTWSFYPMGFVTLKALRNLVVMFDYDVIVSKFQTFWEKRINCAFLLLQGWTTLIHC